MKNINYALVILAGLASGVASAQSGSAGSGPEFVITPSPATAQYLSGVELRPQEKDGVAYLCGGIGDGEAEKIKARASKYDLMMTFAASNGAYLADVDVDIANARGESVFNATCDGPIMLVDLPKGGKYTVRAQAEGKTVTKSANVSDRGSVKRLAMTWPVKVVDMGLTPNIRMGGESDMRSSGASGSTGGIEAGSR